MVMEDTENMTPWFFLANTVFVSIAMVLWYLVIWLEDNKEIDNTNIVIFDSNKFQVNEEDDINIKRDTDGEGVNKHGVTSDKICETEDPRTYEDDKFFQQTISEKDTMGVSIQDDFKQLSIDTEQAAIETEEAAINAEQTVIDTEQTALDTEQNAIDVGQTVIDTEPTAVDTEETAIDTEHVSLVSPNSEIIKTGENLSLGATFQWPRHENTVELLRSGQHQNKVGVSQELQDKLQSLGIMRDSSDQSADGTVPLSDCARLSGKLLGRKVRFCWDAFLAKSRPGLETDSPRQRKSPNKRKQKSVKSVKGWRAASSFVEIVKQDKCDQSFSGALSL